MRVEVRKEFHGSFTQYALYDTVEDRVIIRYASARKANETAAKINSTWSDGL